MSTPQEVALAATRKGIAMFQKVNVPVRIWSLANSFRGGWALSAHEATICSWPRTPQILGIVENMSYYECGGCGSRRHPFGHGGARRTAEAMGVPILAEVPLEDDLCAASDAGTRTCGLMTECWKQMRADRAMLPAQTVAPYMRSDGDRRAAEPHSTSLCRDGCPNMGTAATTCILSLT